jgi:CBS-domain-containing membrane protein
MKTLDVMVRDVVTVALDDTVAEAVWRLAEHDVSALPVVDIEWIATRLSLSNVINNALRPEARYQPTKIQDNVEMTWFSRMRQDQGSRAKSKFAAASSQSIETSVALFAAAQREAHRRSHCLGVVRRRNNDRLFRGKASKVFWLVALVGLD